MRSRDVSKPSSTAGSSSPRSTIGNCGSSVGKGNSRSGSGSGGTGGGYGKKKKYGNTLTVTMMRMTMDLMHKFQLTGEELLSLLYQY